MNYQSIRNFVIGCTILWASCYSPISGRQANNKVESTSSIRISRDNSTVQNEMNNGVRNNMIMNDHTLKVHILNNVVGYASIFD